MSESIKYNKQNHILEIRIDKEITFDLILDFYNRAKNISELESVYKVLIYASDYNFTLTDLQMYEISLFLPKENSYAIIVNKPEELPQNRTLLTECGKWRDLNMERFEEKSSAINWLKAQ
jgi:hypothetical protein